MAKTLKLWFSSREFGRVLSGTEVVTSTTLTNIKNKSGLNITKQDIDNFPLLLKTFAVYNKPIYRGISKTDKLYQQIMNGNKHVSTHRYYSCSKSKLFGQMFSAIDNILLVIKTNKNFDVSHYSREQEVILDRNIVLTVINIIQEDKFTVIYLSD